jgi:hypothetical protein
VSKLATYVNLFDAGNAEVFAKEAGHIAAPCFFADQLE